MTKARTEFADYVVDLLQGIGPVTCKSMFGGFGIFLDGIMFGLIADGQLYLKVDQDSRAAFDELDLPTFTFHKAGKPMQMSYRLAPDEMFESMDAAMRWGQIAYGAALRARSGRRR